MSCISKPTELSLASLLPDDDRKPIYYFQPINTAWLTPCVVMAEPMPAFDASSWVPVEPDSTGSTCSGEPSDESSLTEESAHPRGEQLGEEEVARRRIRLVLNKLTRDRWEPLYEQLAKSDAIQSRRDVEVLMREVFHKSIEEQSFSRMYAELCKQLQQDVRLAKAADGSWEFRRLLLNKCGEAFENVLASDYDSDERAEAKYKALGSMRFIGHLLILDVLSPCFLVRSAEALLHATGNVVVMIECLAALLMIVGPKFDNADFEHCAKLRGVLAEVETMASTGKTAGGERLPSRVRFLLQDVVDFRARGWREAERPGGAAQQHATREDASPQPRRRHVKFRDDGGTHAGRQPPLNPAPGAKPEQEALDQKFDSSFFHRKIASIFQELRMDYNVAKAVKEVRKLKVPEEFQADEFANILTRAAEETRGSARRSAFAFAAGLSAAEQDSAFDRTECLVGLMTFFNEVCENLCHEVPRLHFVVTAELLPTMRAVFPLAELQSVIPEDFIATSQQCTALSATT